MYVVWRCVVLFFFFQAEGGIRDGHVSGVQACALPVCVCVCVCVCVRARRGNMTGQGVAEGRPRVWRG